MEFYVNNQKFEGKIEAYWDSMAIGDEIKIYYNPDNPKEFIADALKLHIFASLIFPAISIGSFLLLKFFKTEK